MNGEQINMNLQWEQKLILFL